MDLIEYLNTKISDLNFDGDISLNWDKESRVFEVEFIFYAPTSSEVDIVDENGEILEDISFEDAVLFYDKNKMDATEYQDSYLNTVGFDGRNGLGSQFIDKYFEHLQKVIDEGQSDLLDFVDGTLDNEYFQVQWIPDDTLPDISSGESIKYPKF